MFCKERNASPPRLDSLFAIELTDSSGKTDFAKLDDRAAESSIKQRSAEIDRYIKQYTHSYTTRTLRPRDRVAPGDRELTPRSARSVYYEPPAETSPWFRCVRKAVAMGGEDISHSRVEPKRTSADPTHDSPTSIAVPMEDRHGRAPAPSTPEARSCSQPDVLQKRTTKKKRRYKESNSPTSPNKPFATTSPPHRPEAAKMSAPRARASPDDAHRPACPPSPVKVPALKERQNTPMIHAATATVVNMADAAIIAATRYSFKKLCP